MRFPDELFVKAMDADTGEVVPDVALVVFLTPPRKNTYCVGPEITDKNSLARFTRVGCERAIIHAQEMFVMDYFGDLVSCAPAAKISLHPPERVSGMISRYETHPEFWGHGFEDAPVLFRSLRSVKNFDFEAAEIIVKENDILANPNVTIRLRKK